MKMMTENDKVELDKIKNNVEELANLALNVYKSPILSTNSRPMDNFEGQLSKL